MLNLKQRFAAASQQPLRPGTGVVAVGLLGSRIGAVEGMGHGAGNRTVGDAEHRLLEADADLHMRVHMTATMACLLYTSPSPRD